MTFKPGISLRKKLARKCARGIVQAIRAVRRPQDRNDQPPWPIVPMARLVALRQRKSGPKPREMRMGYRLSTYLCHRDEVAMSRMAQHDIGGGLQLREYWPKGIDESKARPAMLFLHGGGFVIGDLETHDTLCRFLADRAQVVVFALDYRLAPEHPFPASLEDMKTSFNWLHNNAIKLDIDPGNIGVGGDSAGGRMALTLGLEAHTPSIAGDVPEPAWLWLVYPATDLVMETDSRETFTKDLFLTTPMMNWFREQYVPEDRSQLDLSDPVYSPLKSPDLGKLPRTYLMTVGFDPLRDEGITLKERLEAEGVPLDYAHYPRLAHEIFAISGIVKEAHDAVTDAADALGRLVRADSN